MMTTAISLRSMPGQNTDEAQIFKQVGNQGSKHERHLLGSDLVPWHSARSDLLAATVQISPTDSVKRHITDRHGIVIENIYAQASIRFSLRFNTPMHLLVMYEDGARRDGETSIDGLPPSKLRNFANKMTFVPAGHAYHEWHETSTPTHVTYLYLVPAKLQESSDANATYVPRIFFEDAVVWATATSRCPRPPWRKVPIRPAPRRAEPPPVTRPPLDTKAASTPTPWAVFLAASPRAVVANRRQPTCEL
jgi:hypothetical protein